MLTSDSLKDPKIDSSSFGYFEFVLTSTYFDLIFVCLLLKHLPRQKKLDFPLIKT